MLKQTPEQFKQKIRTPLFKDWMALLAAIHPINYYLTFEQPGPGENRAVSSRTLLLGMFCETFLAANSAERRLYLQARKFRRLHNETTQATASCLLICA